MIYQSTSRRWCRRKHPVSENVLTKRNTSGLFRDLHVGLLQKKKLDDKVSFMCIIPGSCLYIFCPTPVLALSSISENSELTYFFDKTLQGPGRDGDTGRDG